MISDFFLWVYLFGPIETYFDIKSLELSTQKTTVKKLLFFVSQNMGIDKKTWGKWVTFNCCTILFLWKLIAMFFRWLYAGSTEIRVFFLQAYTLRKTRLILKLNPFYQIKENEFIFIWKFNRKWKATKRAKANLRSAIESKPQFLLKLSWDQ